MPKKQSTAFLVVFALLLSSFAVHAQALVPQEKVDLTIISKIKEEGSKNSKVMEYLSYMTDVYGPRLTASPQLKAAEEWAKSKLTEIGLKNARLEAWGPFGRGWTLESFSASMLKPSYAPLIAYPKAWSPSTKGAVRGEVIYLNAQTDADLEKYKGKLKGAIVMLTPAREVKAHFDAESKRYNDEQLLKLANAQPSAGGRGNMEMPPEMRERFQKMMAEQQMAAKRMKFVFDEGAAVTIEPGRGDGGTVFVQGATVPTASGQPRKSAYAPDAPAIVPQVVVAVEHYNRMVRAITKGVPVQMEVNLVASFQDKDMMDYNVIAEIPGSDLKDEIVMLGAHYDSWHGGTGATDNASGSAVMMEAVRILQALGVKPRRTIRIALWSGEEQGLLGSRAYVAQHFAKRTDAGANQQFGPPTGGQPPSTPTFELKPAHEKFSGYFNLDNGTGKIRGIYLQGNEALRDIFRAWLAPFQDMGATTVTISNTGGTDHQAFDGVGLPGFQFIQDEIEYSSRTHHSNMDVYDRIQEEDMKQAATIIAAFVYNTAMRDQKLPRKAFPGQVVTAAKAGQ